MKLTLPEAAPWYESTTSPASWSWSIWNDATPRRRRSGRDSEDTCTSTTNLRQTPRARCALVIAVCGVLGTPARAFAQTDKWEVDVAPLYFWVATTDGNLAINGTRNIPVYMDFADAKSKLAGAFSFHGEARKGPWGVLGDINFIRLSTDVSYTTPIINAPIAGTFQFDQIIFNGKVTYEVKPGTKFHSSAASAP